MTDVTKVCKIL